MIKYIVRRLLGAIPVLFGLSIILFAFVHLLPGDPATAILGQHATPDRVAAMRAYLGLDLPLWQQYLHYVGGLLQGDFGSSVINNQPLLHELLVRFPATIELTVGAMIYAAGVGHPARPLRRPPRAGLARRGCHGRLAAGHQHPGVRPRPDAPVRLRRRSSASCPASGRIDPRANLVVQTNFVLVDSLLMGGSTCSSTGSATSSCRRSRWARSRSRSSPGSRGRPCST